MSIGGGGSVEVLVAVDSDADVWVGVATGVLVGAAVDVGAGVLVDVGAIVGVGISVGIGVGSGVGVGSTWVHPTAMMKARMHETSAVRLDIRFGFDIVFNKK